MKSQHIELTNEIIELKKDKNKIIEAIIILIRSNAAKKKIYTLEHELEIIENILKKKRKEKERLLTNILKAYNI